MSNRREELPKSWQRLMALVRERIPYGDIHIQIIGGEPAKVLDFHREMDLRREDTMEGLLSDTA